MNRKISARIAAVLLVLHGFIEVSGLFALKYMSASLVSFGGMDQTQIGENITSIAALGILWGLTRFAAAWGTWSLRKWGLALGITMSLVTMVVAVTVIPAGVTDTLIAGLVLALLLFTWFGNQKLDLMKEQS
jgi:hypothetical protein